MSHIAIIYYFEPEIDIFFVLHKVWMYLLYFYFKHFS